MRSPPLILALSLLLGWFFVLSGCGPAEPEAHDESEPLLQLLTAYVEASQQLKHPPRNEAELRKFLPPEEADDVFSSPRDHQPYVIRWGVDINDPNLDPANPPMLAYEQTGKDGIRHGVSVMGMAWINEEQFAKLSEN